MNAPPPGHGFPPPPTPAGPPPPSRKIAIAGNVVLAIVLMGSFGGCMQWGCQYAHLPEATSFGLAFASIVVCLVAGITATVVFAQNLRRKEEAAVTVTGLVLTVVLSVTATVLSPLFWLFAGSGPVGFGGWGRPLRIRRRAVTPGVRASTEWANGPRPDVGGLDAETRAVLRDLWLHDARKEHASVPAFGQVAWQLVALGAPADLVRRAHASCLQEIDHAERCFALASAYAGEDLGVQEMPALLPGGAALPRDRERALVKVATEALVDGALLEDYNAELAATALADVEDAAAREALVRIVEDEREHAALAWDIIAFCVERGGEPVARALRKTFAALEAEPVSLYDPELERRVEAVPDATKLHAHGRVRREVVRSVFRARKDAAARTLETLLARPALRTRAA